jgi:hypothetical protein
VSQIRKQGRTLGIHLVGSLRIPPAFGDSRDGGSMNYDRRRGPAKGRTNLLRICQIYRLQFNPEEPTRAGAAPRRDGYSVIGNSA